MAALLKETGWFEIFRTGMWNGGTYMDAEGRWLDDRAPFDVTHLQKMVSNFEPGNPDPVIRLGHEKFFETEEKPAMGFVAGLEVRPRSDGNGYGLWAKARDVQPELQEAVASKKYPKVSCEIYYGWQASDGTNKKFGPVLGGVAFLGASLPAVSGMEEAQFSLSPAMQECAKALFSLHQFAAVGVEIETFEGQKPEGGDDVDKAEFEALKAQTEAQKTEIERLRAENALQTLAAKLERCKAFVNGLLEAKKLTPAVANSGLAAALAGLDDTQECEFAEGQKTTQYGFFAKIVGELVNASALFQEAAKPEAAQAADIDSQVKALADKFGLDAAEVQKQFHALLHAKANSEGAADSE